MGELSGTEVVFHVRTTYAVLEQLAEGRLRPPRVVAAVGLDALGKMACASAGE